MWFIKYLTIFVYSVGLYTISFYINFLAFSDWLSNKNQATLNKTYDYIIVGSGSAGSIVALRLSAAKNNTILLVEAGSHGGRLLDVPMEGPALQGTAADWHHTTAPQKSACFGLKNKQSIWPLGKITGGSMYLNNLVYLRGHPSDYKNWFENSFNYNEDVLSYFKKSEDQRGSYKNDLKNHATGGPFVVDDIPFVSQFGKAVLEAGKTLGFPIVDLNSDQNIGFMPAQVNVRSGERFTTNHYLQEQKRDNVQILTQALVHRVLFRSNFEATGIELTFDKEMYRIKAKKAVILSAGAVGTAKILLHSGVGPNKHLEETGISAKIDLPVGENLQDHVTTGLDLILLNQSIDMSMEKCLSPFSVFEYVFFGGGPLSSPGCEVVGLLDFDGDSQPDLQLMVIPLGISIDGGLHFRKTMGISDESFEYFAKLLHKTTASVLPILLHPKSVGFVRLRDKNVRSAPIINPNYLQSDFDVNVLLEGIDFVKKLLKTEAMQKLGAALNTEKFPGCEEHEFDSKTYWECYVRHLTLTSYHPVGTCKMGGKNDEKRVVDRNFKVRGTNKLFVGDASVLPTLPSGNVNAAVVMMAEKAAESVGKEDFLSTGFCKSFDVFFFRKI